MRVCIQPSAIQGTIKASSSKSAMQRACALALLHNGVTIISNPGKSNDELAALNFIKFAGAAINPLPNGDLKITNNEISGSSITSNTGEISVGESGLALRMFTPIAALSSNTIVITGEGSLLKRPINLFDEIFPQLGINISTNHGKLPIQITGPLHPTDITIDGSVSSQFLTGLLLSFAKAATRTVTITVTNLTSKPYIDLTLQMMKYFGYEISHDRYEKFIIQPTLSAGEKMAHQISYTVENDWSSASFILVAGAIAGNITVNGLDVFSAQADKSILQVLMMTGANLSVTENEIIVSSIAGKKLKAFHFDATDCPDLFPPLVALASYCEGISVITGISRLLHKESNRAIALQKEFAKMGVEIKLQDDLMLIHGGSVIGAIVHSNHDHRIAMACAVAALKANGQTVIEEAGAVNKSYPGFFEDLKLMGADVSLLKS